MRRAALLLILLTAAGVSPQGPARRPPPRLIPKASAGLLMRAMNAPNFTALGKRLRDKPADEEAWPFMRGQALLIAESGNLLMLRPPGNAGDTAWLRRCAELREAAGGLADALRQRDYLRSRAGLVATANTCNRCHRDFRVAERVVPFGR